MIIKAAPPISGTYSSIMLATCKPFGMKPVWYVSVDFSVILCFCAGTLPMLTSSHSSDHPSYCKNDKKSLYIGQRHHIGYRPHRNKADFFGAGFEKIKAKWDGLCGYCGKASKGRALCNIPINSHSWRTPAQANPGVRVAPCSIPMFDRAQHCFFCPAILQVF